MTDKPFNVLILCTGNSARSILGEALINHWGRGKFVGYSAGSTPKGKVHPIALELLRQLKMPTEGLRSKSWDEFAKARRAQARFRLHGLRQRRGRNLSVLARAADDGALGRRRSRRPWKAATRKNGWLSAPRFASSRTASRCSPRLPIRTLDRAKLQARLHEIGARHVEQAG